MPFMLQGLLVSYWFLTRLLNSDSLRSFSGILHTASVRVWYIDYTESGENHGTMILDGACYSVIHFFKPSC